ncbi:MAG TPA: sulfatase [Vicinamibacterales bacterium]|nr:sulfatase [Vicinamibacterales bacterium]
MSAFLTIRVGLLTLVTTAVAMLGAAWWRTARPEPEPIGVVLITLDTTRADRLSPYGLMDVSMPHLERLAREGVVFDRATSVAPLTLPAHSSIFTGLFPAAHGVRDNADQPLSAERTTLAEILKAQGFETAAFVASAVLDPGRGLDQGFHKYSGVSQTTLTGRTTSLASVESRQRRGDEVMSDAVKWLDGIGDARFFLWTHLYDPHRPYDPPEPFRSRQFDPYIGEIAFVDSQIGRLLEALEHRGLLDRTLVVVAGDHGESLGEHGERDHGIFLYESVLRVPLIVRGPGFAPRRVGDVVRLVDVMPTILDALDLSAPAMDGVSLVDVMHGTRRVDLEVVAESMYPLWFGWSPLRALRSGRFKLVDAPRPELYDLERDPVETRNLFDDRPALADAMTRRLDALAGGRHTLRDLNRGAVPAELRDDLAALGYVTGSPMRTSANQNNLPDPKDRIGTMSRP